MIRQCDLEIPCPCCMSTWGVYVERDERELLLCALCSCQISDAGPATSGEAEFIKSFFVMECAS